MENSKKMTLEERVVQKLKDDTLMSLIGDEDALTDLVRRAITEALYARRTEKDGTGWRTIEVNSPVVEAAGNAARAMCATIMSELLKDDAVKKTIRDAILDVLPEALMSYVGGHIHSLLTMTSENAIARVRELKNSDRL